MKKQGRRRKILLALGITLIALAGFLWATNRAVIASAEGKIFDLPEQVPDGLVGLVLGTAPTIQGRPNLFFMVRMEAAAKLYRAGKIKKVLVSGDNHAVTYDEPTAMREALVKLGVPKEDIAIDYAGFRTLDSVIRAKEVFGQERLTIIGDDFHLPRALYIASEIGVEAIGFQTRSLNRSISPRTYFSEIGARTLVWIDLKVFNRQPKFLGPRESI